MTSLKFEQIVFTFTDMKHLFLRQRRRILLFMMIAGFCIFTFLLLRPVQYQVEASFKGGKEADVSSQMKKMVQQFVPTPSETGIIAVMQSNEVIKSAVEKQGMQVVCRLDSLISRLFKRMAGNLCLELGGTLSDKETFSFANVSYAGEKTLPLYLKMKDRQTYQLLDSNQKLLGEAKVGGSLSFPSGHLTLVSLPTNVRIGSFYPISVHPWIVMIKNIKSRLKISPHKLDKDVLQLTFLSPDRGAGACFLNGLMQSYRDYLRRENDETCQIQLDYLKERQEEVLGHYNKALIGHATYLQENLEVNGYMGFEQEITTLSVPKNAYTAKLFEVDLEIKRLSDAMNGSSVSDEDLSTQGSREENLPICYPLDQEGKILERELKCPSNEFVGLNLETAQKLLVEYTRQRDGFQAQIKELGFLIQQLKQPGVEVSSLGDLYEDGVVREQVNKASAIALQLQDENNRSTREHERLIEALQTQKNFLSHYLLQTVELKKLRLKLLGEKVGFLQQATLSLLQTEKDLLKAKLHELNGRMEDLPEKWRHESLFQMQTELWASTLEGVSQLIESKFLGQRVFQATSRPLDLGLAPLKPKLPNILLSTLVSTFLLGGLFYFFLFCHALLKGVPVSDQMLRLLGFHVSGRLSHSCSSQLPTVCGKDLDAMRHVAELLAPKSKTGGGQVAVCIGGQYPDYSSPLAQLLAMRGMQVVVLHCVFDEPAPQEEIPGLCHYLQGEIADLPLKRHLSYDLITSGGVSLYGAEMLCGSKFKNLLSDLKERYEIILLYSSFKPANIEGSSLLKLADVALITVQQETKEDLEVYQEWEEQKGRGSVSFLYAEEFMV